MTDTYTVERSTTIDAPPSRVYPRLVDLRQWQEWSPWAEMDPNAEKTYSGAESGPGAKYEWSGNRKVGRGSMEITDATEPSAVQIALEFIKPLKASNTTVLELRAEGDGTKVTWRMSGQKTLMTRVLGVFKSMDSMVGSDFERGLAKLKRVVEAEAG
jgi:uncharacterized protein YndB with AHSA1/START domain